MIEKIPSEHQEQAYLVQWFRRAYPGVRIFAIPNGGARSITTATKLKIEGVSKGVPDLFVPAWHLWIEMKRIKGGRLSQEQKDWLDYLDNVGYSVIVGHGALDTQEQIIKGNYGKQD